MSDKCDDSPLLQSDETLEPPSSDVEICQNKPETEIKCEVDSDQSNDNQSQPPSPHQSSDQSDSSTNTTITKSSSESTACPLQAPSTHVSNPSNENSANLDSNKCNTTETVPTSNPNLTNSSTSLQTSQNILPKPKPIERPKPAYLNLSVTDRLLRAWSHSTQKFRPYRPHMNLFNKMWHLTSSQIYEISNDSYKLIDFLANIDQYQWPAGKKNDTRGNGGIKTIPRTSITPILMKSTPKQANISMSNLNDCQETNKPNHKRTLDNDSIQEFSSESDLLASKKQKPMDNLEKTKIPSTSIEPINQCTTPIIEKTNCELPNSKPLSQNSESAFVPIPNVSQLSVSSELLYNSFNYYNIDSVATSNGTNQRASSQPVSTFEPTIFNNTGYCHDKSFIYSFSNTLNANEIDKEQRTTNFDNNSEIKQSAEAQQTFNFVDLEPSCSSTAWTNDSKQVCDSRAMISNDDFDMLNALITSLDTDYVF